MDNTVQPIQNLLTEEQKKQLADVTPVGQEELAQRIFGRLAEALTQQDIEKIKELDKNDLTGDTVRYFLLSKVPNLDAIIKEELEIFKEKMHFS